MALQGPTGAEMALQWYARANQTTFADTSKGKKGDTIRT